MHTAGTISLKEIFRVLSIFGVWGWVDLFAALLVAMGCAGDWIILLKRTPEHSAGHGTRMGMRWRAMILFESCIKKIGSKIKFVREKLSKDKEHILERQFATIIALGVGIELFALPFTLYEAALVAKEASDAHERVVNLESNNLVLRSNVVALELKLIETSNNVVKIDPSNRTILNVSASGWLVTKTNLRNAKIDLVNGGGESVTLSLGKSEEAKTNIWKLVMHLRSIDDVGGSFLGLEFIGDIENPLWNLRDGDIVREADNWDVVQMSASFIPSGAEIEKGEISIVFNSAFKKTFRIPRQIAGNPLEAGQSNLPMEGAARTNVLVRVLGRPWAR